MKRIWIWVLWAPWLAAQVVPDLFIVELPGEPAAVASGKGGRAAVADRRAQIQAQQQGVRQALAQIGAEVLDSMDTVANALIVRMPESEAAALPSVPGVMRVHRVYEVKPLLDHALPLMSVPDAWNRFGGIDRAGLGIKIGIIDTGIDHEHPAMRDDSLVVPAGYPKVRSETHLAFTNRKVIVAKTYETLLGRSLEEASPRDSAGHGTAVAMAAAGAAVQAPLALISGVAPKAFLGNYKVFAGNQETTRTDVVLKAIDDAVADGMDVINVSVGTPLAERPERSLEAQAVERAFEAGVLVVTAAGNEGPDPNTINVFATAPSAIAVGASSNDRAVVSSAVLIDGVPYAARPGNGPSPSEPITAALADVSRLDQDGLACAAFPEGSLRDRIAFILRGVCRFEEKINNAQRAGAVAALLYTHADSPNIEDFQMDVGAATLPATMISYADGLEIKRRLSENPDLQATLTFRRTAVGINPNRLSSFSSRGPNPDGAIKPDLLAVGSNVYTATQSWNPVGDLYSDTGFATFGGTSFSSPMVAGAAALLKAARPGLTARRYRSLLVNSARPIELEPGQFMPVQSGGAGRLNLLAAVEGTATAFPTSLSFGAGGGTFEEERWVTVANTGTAVDTFTLGVVPIGGGPAPLTSLNTVQLAPGATQDVRLRLSGVGLEPGEYQGFLVVRGTRTGSEARIPYWYAVTSSIPANLTILSSRESGSPGSLLREAFYFRITDRSGVPVRNVEPVVTAASGGGEVVRVFSIDDDIPGAWAVNVRLGADSGRNVFRIRAGDLEKTVAIQGRASLLP